MNVQVLRKHVRCGIPTHKIIPKMVLYLGEGDYAKTVRGEEGDYLYRSQGPGRKKVDKISLFF